MKLLNKILLLLFVAIAGVQIVRANRHQVDVDTLTPLTVHFGKSSLTCFGYGQCTYTLSQTAGSINHAFAISRVMLMADIRLTEKLSCFLMGNMANATLHEYYAQYNFCPAFKVRVGQFKQPFTLENTLSPSFNGNISGDESVLYMAGIATDSCYGTGRAGRDVGMMVIGDVIPHQGYMLLHYRLGVFNGAGMNVRENNKYKDLIGMLKLRPLKELMLSTSFILGKTRAQANHPYGLFAAGDNYTRNRWSVGGEIITYPLHLRSEFMLGYDAGIRSKGYYALFEGHVTKWLDLVVGYDYLKRNNKWSASAINNYLAGLQFWIYKKCCIRSQYVCKNTRQGQAVHFWISQFQIRF